MHRQLPKAPTACRGLLGAVLLIGLLAIRPATALACQCDCNDDGQVTVDELLKGVNIALGIAPVGDCTAMDIDHSGTITVDELLAAVNIALTGCPVDTATPTPTATPAETLTPTASPTETPTSVPMPVIETIVGSGLAGFTGDGNAPLDTALYLPQDITIGPDGLLYIADWNNHRIRRLNGAGVIETVAGTGDLGSAMDGNALQTDFNHPTNVYFDPQDGIQGMIISAWHNSEVKRVDLTTEVDDDRWRAPARAPMAATTVRRLRRRWTSPARR